jgi:hypothetical protein
MTGTPAGTTTIRMAGGTMGIDDASDTLWTALSRIFRPIKAVNLRGIKAVNLVDWVPLYSIAPQTWDRIYRGVKSVLWAKVGLRGGVLVRLAEWPCFMAALTFPP